MRMINPVYLVSYQDTGQTDDYGETILKEIRTKAIAGMGSIRQDEYYAADNRNMKPTSKLTVWLNDYHGEENVRFENNENCSLYTIYRTFEIDGTGKIELYIMLKVGNKSRC